VTAELEYQPQLTRWLPENDNGDLPRNARTELALRCERLWTIASRRSGATEVWQADIADETGGSDRHYWWRSP
jgi:hypothetical protein